MGEFKSVDAWAAYRDDGTLIEARTDWGNVSHRTNAVDIRPVTISPRAAWVKVSERLPELHTDVLMFIREYPGATSRLHTEIRFGQRVGSVVRWWFETENGLPYDRGEVTHWQPAHVPQAPEGE